MVPRILALLLLLLPPPCGCVGAAPGGGGTRGDDDNTCGSGSCGESEERYPLSDFALALHRAEFLNIDRDGNGRLDFYEVQDHFVAAPRGPDGGTPHESRTTDTVEPDDIEGFLEDLDADFDGHVSWEEYLHSLQGQQFNVPITDLGE